VSRTAESIYLNFADSGRKNEDSGPLETTEAARCQEEILPPSSRCSASTRRRSRPWIWRKVSSWRRADSCICRRMSPEQNADDDTSLPVLFDGSVFFLFLSLSLPHGRRRCRFFRPQQVALPSMGWSTRAAVDVRTVASMAIAMVFIVFLLPFLFFSIGYFNLKSGRWC